jgi:CPA2 family monovalent cation:H+ antiporter-2
MHASLLADLVILLAVSIVALYASHLAKLPAIVGFLVAGMIIGPDALALVSGVEEVALLAEVGVVFLLFTIGLEFSLADLLKARRAVLLGGTIQVLLVTVVVFALLTIGGLPANESLFLGMIASLSSTAVVLRLLQQNAEIDAPHGRMSLAILVYQDLMIVPMMLLIPVLGGEDGGLGRAFATFLGKTAVVLVAVVVLARYVVPQLLDRVVHTRNRDLFLLTVVGTCLVVAWLSALAGLSLALGAFLAGLLVSESEYSHQALADILPFRDLFAAFFFVSIGMLLDLAYVVQEPLLLGFLVVAVLSMKAAAAALSSALLGASLRTGVMTGLAMSQVGEFSFVLAGAGVAAGLLTDSIYQSFVATAVATIGLTPFLLRAAPRVADVLGRLPLPDRLVSGRLAAVPADPETVLENHLVVIGYGVNGRNVSRAARIAGIPYVAVDTNPGLVHAARAEGAEIYYGDATRDSLLEQVGVSRARVVVVALSDAAATRRVIALARGLNSTCSIVARTRYVREMEALGDLGASIVIPEELETSVEIVSRVLASYLIPRREIEAFVSEIRSGGYEMWRRPTHQGDAMFELRQTLTDVDIMPVRVADDGAIVGQKLAESDLRRLYGITVLAIRREDELVPNPGGDEVVRAGDVLVVMGLGEEIAAARDLFVGPSDEP